MRSYQWLHKLMAYTALSNCCWVMLKRQLKHIQLIFCRELTRVCSLAAARDSRSSCLVGAESSVSSSQLIEKIVVNVDYQSESIIANWPARRSKPYKVFALENELHRGPLQYQKQLHGCWFSFQSQYPDKKVHQKGVSLNSILPLYPSQFPSSSRPINSKYIPNQQYIFPTTATMPKQIKNAKQFLNLLKDPKSSDKSKKPSKKTVFIKKNARVTKFKIRRGRYFFTFKADKPNVVAAIESGLGKDVEKIEIKKRTIVAKKSKK